MYSHCLFCQADLGRNEVVERFPVGRRLAFDAAKGRLWVVCRGCERWNLTPLEERWEAIEECERLYRDTHRRVATGNVGLARLPEGLELVRIGQPRRPEFAAWRYGDQFGRRRRRLLLNTGAGVAAAGTFIAAGPLFGAAAGLMATVGISALNIAIAASAARGGLVLPHPTAPGRLHVTVNQLHELRLVQRPGEGAWGLEVPYSAHSRPDDDLWQRIKNTQNVTIGRITVEGAAARSLAGRIMPRINAGGARDATVQDAVAFIEQVGDPAAVFGHAAGRTREWGREQRWGDTGALRFLPRHVRLALEMASHEDAERAALEEGELAALEAAWREAEEIAAIADGLALPAGVEEGLRKLKGR